MKKILLITCFTLVASFAFGQAVTIDPTNPFQDFKIVNDNNYSGLRFFSGTAGPFSGTFDGALFSRAGTDDYFNLTGGSGTPGIVFKRATNKVGIGTFDPSAKTEILYNSTITDPTLLLTESSSSDGSRLMFKNSYSSSFTLWGAPASTDDASTFNFYHSGTAGNIMTLKGSGYVGIGEASPSAKLHINHGYAGTTSLTPNILLEGNSSSSYTAMQFGDDASTRRFTQLGYTKSATDASNYLLFNYKDAGNIFILRGDRSFQFYGDGRIDGYTKLGNTAPEIKMKTLSGTTSATQGLSTPLAHGLSDADRILDVQIMIEYATNNYIPSTYTQGSGYESNYYYNDTYIILVNKAGSSGSILSKPFKILVTYEE